MRKLPLLLITILLLNILLVTAQNYTSSSTIDVIFFRGQGCPHCAAEEEFFKATLPKYPTVVVQDYEIYFNTTNRQLMQDLAKAYGQEVGGVPTTFIGGKMIVGFNDAIGNQIEQTVRDCIELGCQNPLDRLKDQPAGTEKTKQLTIGAVFSSGLVDSMNPCAFAVLILLLTTITTAGGRKKALFAGFAFIAAIFLSYLTMGLGLFSALRVSGMSRTLLVVMATIAILVGLFNIKDYFWYGKWFIMEVPRAWRPKMHMIAKSATSIPGAFVIGVLLSMFLLPCTSGPYIVILGLLAQTATKNYAIMMMLLHNIIFVTPMILITLGVYFGLTTTEKAEEFRSRRLKQIHLIAGIIMILLGIGLFIAMGLGYM